MTIADADDEKEEIRAAITLIYIAGFIYAAGAKHLLVLAVIYGPGTVLYFMARQEQGRPVFTSPEIDVFAIAALGRPLRSRRCRRAGW